MDQFVASFSKLSTKEKRSIDDIIKYIKDKNPKDIIVMTGAGISTSAGIPDFRSSSGLYEQDLDVPYPEAVFELSYFKKQPKPFYKLAKQLYGQFSPTTTHYFLKLLHERNILRRIYTQNIDSLERIAGIPHEVLVEAHGTFSSSTCLDCKSIFDTLEIVIPLLEKDEIPYCKCGGYIKPDIVFFGENLPSRFFQLYQADFKRCDLLIIIGTSLVVQPFAGLIDLVDCPRLLLNKEPVRGFGDRELDVEQLGDCDDSVTEIIALLKWDEQFAKVLQHRVDLMEVKEKSETLKSVREEIIKEKEEREEPLNVEEEPVIRKLSITSLPSDVSGIFSVSDITSNPAISINESVEDPSLNSLTPIEEKNDRQ